MSATPEHYAGKVTPWDLERCMKSSGNAFVDSRRTDAIEYCFRMKSDLLDDLRKARHCIDEAIKVLEGDTGIPASDEDPRDEALRHILSIMREKDNLSKDLECGSTSFKSVLRWADYKNR